MNKPKVLLIGWDAADWKVIQPLMEEGLMPTLQQFLQQGVHGNIATLQPVLSPMLWTSIATGKRAWQHGIHGFTELNAEGTDLQPINVTSRKVKAIWNILNQQGYKSNVVGWWPSHPAEPINGAMVSNFYQKDSAPLPDRWELAASAIHPPELYNILKSLRVHPAELTGAMVLPFIPKASELDIQKDKVLQNTMKVLSHAASIHNAATYLMENTEWDFMAVYHDAIDHWSHLAMKFHPPKQAFIPEEKFALYKDIVRSGYRFHDMMLERYLALVDENTTVILLSDHGFHSDHLRPHMLPKEPAAPAHEHRQFGILAMRGPQFKQGETIYGSRLLDITPTLLQLFNLPIGQDMEGQVLVQAFRHPIEVKTVASWEEIPGISGQHLQGLESSGEEAREGLKQLEELGYIEPLGPNKAANIERSLRENRYNLAISYLDGNQYQEGAKLLEELWREDPNAMRYLDRLVRVHLKLNQVRKAQDFVNEALARIEKSPRLLFLEGLVHAAAGRDLQALKTFDQLLELAPEDVNLLNQVARVHRMRDSNEEAETWFRKALALDAHNTIAMTGIGLCLLKSEQYEAALDMLLQSVEQLYTQPMAHLYIGEALRGLELWAESAQAFELTKRMMPNNGKVLHYLLELYADRLGDTEKAKAIEIELENLQKEPVIVVSGLPRSGTSLMMQLLERAGIELLVDDVRQADDSNPKGYYELDAVKRLRADKNWLESAQGKAVKVVAPLLPSLPVGQRYKVIFMKRSLTEVLVSQQVMMGKKREDALKNFPLRMANQLQQQYDRALQWMQRQPHVDFIEIGYEQLLAHDSTVEDLLSALLETPVNESIWKAVDQQLHRNKLTS